MRDDRSEPAADRSNPSSPATAPPAAAADPPVLIVGAGPAGLTAAWELAQAGLRPIVVERGDRAGGLARTETYEGYRFDIGGHRFFTQVAEVEAIWHKVLGPDLLRRPRLSRIYYRGQFYHYPLRLPDTLWKLGLRESTRIALSFARWQLRPYPREDSFEEWVTNRFGRRLYEIFFKPYTEKVWGMPCNQIRAEWAAQRIRGLSLRAVVLGALGLQGQHVTSLIEAFWYPRLGPGMMWERMADELARAGATVALGHELVALGHDGHRLTSARVRAGDTGSVGSLACRQVISTMPLPLLIQRLDPPAPAAVARAAAGLKYRDFLIVVLIVERAAIFPDNWIYIHDPHLAVGRIQNFKNWSPDMVPDPATTSLGLEYFCSAGDPLWEATDAALLKLATGELAQLGLATADEVRRGTVIRQRQAYPVYDEAYQANLLTIQAYLRRFDTLQTVGRNGMHRYNNQDHSMLTGLLAARNILGAAHDLWDVNTQRSYQESFVLDPARDAHR